MSESVCRKCDGFNPNWSASSPLWNAVMRGGCINGEWEYGEIICPSCFIGLAVERGVAAHFYLTSDNPLVALQTVTPSGRVWNEQERLWQ